MRRSKPGSRHDPLVLFDFDGYFSFLLSREADAHLTHPIDPVSLSEFPKISLVHFLLRSTMVLSMKAGEREQAVLRYWDSLCLRYALSFVRSGPALDVLSAPLWAGVYADQVKEELREAHPLVDEIKVVATLEPRLYARSFPVRKLIHVSVLTREYLRSANLYLWNHAYAMCDKKVEPGAPFEFDNPADAFLPFLVSLYRYDVDYAALPAPMAHNSSALCLAMLTSSIQLKFMLAHEYAHLLLHDGAVRNTEAMEAEADAFAYDVLFQVHKVGELWIAIRWLYRLLALERIVGALLCGGPVDWDQDEIMGRGYKIMKHVADKGMSRDDNQLEIFGTTMLMAAKGQLKALCDRNDGSVHLLIGEHLNRLRSPWGRGG